jgi:hypothetical protein
MSNQTKLGLAIIILFTITGSIITLGILTETPCLALPGTITVTPIIYENVTISAKTSLDYQFKVPPDVTNTWISGTFTAQGGTTNDIKVYIFDNTNFNNYNTGQNFTAIYQSGQTSNSTISVNNISNGSYYLVLDNEFSTSQKTINISAYTTPSAYTAPWF